MSNDEKALELFRQLDLSGLPVGVYLVTPEGLFLECSRRVREILKLPPEGPINASILDFYYDPSRRAELIQKLEEAEAQGRWLENELIHFRVQGRDIFVRNSCRFLRDPDTGQVLGFVGSMVNVTEEERIRRLFDHVQTGIYRVDADNVLVYANDAFARILGYRSGNEVEGWRVRMFYARPEEAKEFSQRVRDSEDVVRETIELVKEGGEVFFGAVTATRILGPGGGYEGREGTLVDVAEEERYRRSLESLPVGYYRVRIEDGRELIRHCNEEFSKMFDFDSLEHVRGYDIAGLYIRAEDRDIFKRELGQAGTTGLLGYELNVRSLKGREFWIEVNTREIRDREGNITGRTGVVRDITEEHQLREQIEDLQHDVGRTLHAYSTVLLTARHTLAAAVTALGPDPFGPGIAPLSEEVEETLSEPWSGLVQALDKLLASVGSDRRAAALSPEKWDELAKLLNLLKEEVGTLPLAEARPPLLRRISREVINICSRIERGFLSRETVREVRRSAEQLERVACLVALRYAEESVITMDYQVRSLRERIISGVRREEPEQVYPLWDLVLEAMNNLDEFAASMDVEIRLRDRTRGACVKAVRQNVVRALGNLLHNAVKYSWSRGPGGPRWVGIRAYVKGILACVAFENFGVPIPEDELESGLIFQLGFRGSQSGDRGRLGTGIGLTDALHVAKRYGGNATVKSLPASPGAPLDDYSVPYLTTVTFSLPVHEERKGA